jgi:hypothetical protein
MYVIIQHQIHDPQSFQACAEKAFPLPEDLTVHFFLPARDFSHATCLYEAPSLERVRDFVDGLLGACCTNTYHAVAAEHAMGLPETQAA